jgi:hypothetical protein
MTARSKLLSPGHRVSVRNHPAGKTAIQDATIYLSPGDTLTITTPAPPPVVTPPPTTSRPPIPAGAGTLFRHDFATDGMGPFKILTYPNDHEDDADLMLGWKRYGHPEDGRYLTQKFVTDAVRTSVHDGYLDQLCSLDPATNIWLASFAGTFDIATNKFTKSFVPPFRVRWCIDLGGKAGKADWRGSWVYGSWLNRNLEVPDFPEVIGGKVTANLHPGRIQIASQPVPTGWTIYESIVLPTSVAVRLADKEVGKRDFNVGTGPLGLYIDSKVGLDFPDASTGSPRIKTAWVTVDPA